MKAGAVSTTSALAQAAHQVAEIVSTEKDTKVEGSTAGKAALADGKAVVALAAAIATPKQVKGTMKKVKAEVKSASDKAFDQPHHGHKQEAKTETKAEEKPAEKQEAEKLKAARKVFDKHKLNSESKPNSAGFIAGKIKEELKITYSNAYYYVTRVFGIKSEKAKA